MSFFTPEEKRQREEALQQQTAGRAENDQYIGNISLQVLPKALEEIRSAYASGRQVARFNLKADPLGYPHANASVTVDLCTFLAELITRETGYHCSVSPGSFEWAHNEVSVEVTFTDPSTR